MILRLLLAIVVIAALPDAASACRIPTDATFVFETLPPGIPDDALVLRVKFSPPLTFDGFPRRRQVAMAQVRRVVRGAPPGRSIRIALPGTPCSGYLDTTGGLMAGRMGVGADGAPVFRPYWILSGERRSTSEPELRGPD